jgi:hypothetical protein
MEEQKIIITKTESEVNREIENGWRIKSVTAQQVATGGGSHLYGSFLIVLYKPYEML